VSIADKILTCRDCHEPFTWTVGEQNFFRAKGLQNIPARCDECRNTRRKEARTAESANAPRVGSSVRTKAVCANCQTETVVPFAPRNGKPVYCSSCYYEIKNRTEAEVAAAAGTGESSH
jgi:CxxC-x17-CxxC domain-containing protein